MVQSNKVLTVSYGTFSCTLEGFEDSFGTMKAIAEYFRDLSADDRYFGAEPVQPDADMLAQIAQREISRRVEAHKSSNGIVLRAEQASGLATAALAAGAATAAPAASAEAEAEAEPDEVVQEPKQPIVAEEPAQVAEPKPIEPQQVADVGPETETADDAIAEAISEPVAAADTIPVAEDIEVSDVVPAADSIAAKLNRIRAVVSRNEALDVEDEYEDDQDAEAFLSSTADVLAAHLNADDDLSDTNGDDDRLSELLGQMDADDDADDDDVNKETAELPDVDVSASDALEDTKTAEIAEREELLVLDADKADADQLDDDDDHFDDDIDDDDIWAAEEAWNVLADDDFDTEIETRADTTVESDQVIEKAAEIKEAAEAEADADELKHAGEKSDAAEFFNVYDGDDDYDDDDDELFADLADRNKTDATDDDGLAALTDNDLDDAEVDQSAAQVLKVRRADLEAALADGAVEKVDDTDTGSTLSPEAEDDLMRELAEVEAEIAVTDDADKTETEDTDDADDDLMLSRSLDDDDEDLSRLMSAASTKMEEPESTSRREAYNHLRAAVAAAKADTSIRDEASGEKASQAFHSDLESVVRPRRPEVSAAARQARPSDERPAPLKLVAEQRVDIIAEQASHGPVRPRRVETAEDDMEAPQTGDTEGGFAEFAREMGATELPDLLEAAAAYMSFVEGRDEFSRPQLMTKVRQVEMRDFNREDGLRSFGKLLRDGKIEKISGGRFTASEQIGFKPQDRAVG